MREDIGTGGDRKLGWESLLMEKLDLLLDRRSPEPRRRFSVDPDRNLEVDEGSDSRRRYHPGSHITSGNGSLVSVNGGLRAFLGTPPAVVVAAAFGSKIAVRRTGA